MINKVFKILFLGVFLFFLVLMQTSFLNIYTNFNFVILFVIVINLIENPENNFGLLSAFFSGLFLDLSTTYQFGLFTLGLVFFSLIGKIILLKFLKVPYVSWIPKI